MGLSGKRGGYVLMECALAACVVGLAAAAAVPMFQTYEENRLLDGAAAQAMAVIYEAEAAVKNGAASAPNAAEKVDLIFTAKNSRVYYYCTRGSTRVGPTGYLPAGVKVTPDPAKITFNKNRFNLDSQTATYSFKLRSEKNEKKGRDIVTAMYTGRVHVEESKL